MLCKTHDLLDAGAGRVPICHTPKCSQAAGLDIAPAVTGAHGGSLTPVSLSVLCTRKTAEVVMGRLRWCVEVWYFGLLCLWWGAGTEQRSLKARELK